MQPNHPITRKELYEKHFPSPIARRMIEQMSEVPYEGCESEDTEPSHHLDHFQVWTQTKEGLWFWNDIERAYYRNEEKPTEEQVKAVFTKHNIEYV